MNIRIILSTALLFLTGAAGFAVAADKELSAPAQPRAQYGDDLSSEAYQACARYGRCRDLGTRSGVQRWDRRAPQAPGAPIQPVTQHKAEPTPAENIVPQYRESGQIRQDFANSGKPVNEDKHSAEEMPAENETPAVDGRPIDKTPPHEAPPAKAGQP